MRSHSDVIGRRLASQRNKDNRESETAYGLRVQEPRTNREEQTRESAMHTISEMGTSVPAFLGKLWRLVEDPETDDLICWSPNGRSFFIRNQAQFARELLPHYYKHNNMASFVRQLNMYGFHKKVSVELGGLKCDRDEMEFAHQYFCKDHPYLLDHIKRKIASNKTQDPSQTPIKPELMNRMLTEVRSMRGRQEHFDSRLGAMKRENEALWRELALLRQKHHKQQQIVNKLIHFLVSLVQTNRNSGLSMKRRYPLMIDDSSRQRSKQSKLSKAQHSPIGPAIHELDSSDPDLDSDYIVAEMLDDQTPTIESPEHRSAAEDNLSEYYIDEPVQLQQDIELRKNTNVSKKRLKSKKKGEETLLLEVPLETVQASSTSASAPSVSSASTVLAASSTETSKKTASKPVPMASMRSSKLAAMAANMRRSQESELELDVDSYPEAEESEPKRNNPMVKLENILIVPEVNDEFSPEAVDYNGTGSNVGSSVSSLSTNSGSPIQEAQGSPEISDIGNGSFGNLDFILDSDQAVDEDRANAAGTANKSPAINKTDGSKNLSLSCVNQGNTSETNYREEVDTHLDSMQSDLENLREMLRGEGYSIDANTLLGVSNALFGAEDPMSFGIPVNPDLDPHSNGEKDDMNHVDADQGGSSNKGELMTYNAGPNLLDFDDDIFLGPSQSPVPATSDGNNVGQASDPLELSDSKGSIFDSLIANNSCSPQS